MSVTAAQAIANYQSITAVATSVSGTEGAAISGATVATFTDANPNATAGDFTATINWGDGTSTTGTVVAQTKLLAGSPSMARTPMRTRANTQ